MDKIHNFIVANKFKDELINMHNLQNKKGDTLFHLF